MSKKAGRNDPCPCGSRKKYKSCCWKNEQPKSDVSRNSLFPRISALKSSGLARKFTATLVQGKAKDLIEQRFEETLGLIKQEEAPPVPPSSEIPEQVLPESYKPWTPPTQETLS